MGNSKVWRQLIIYVTLAFMLICALFPIYWMLNTSFKTQSEIYNQVPTFWPREFTWNSYVTLLTVKNFLINIKNTLIVAVSVSIASVFVSMLSAYAISRVQFTGRRFISNSILYAYLMPKSVLFIPLYILVTKVNLEDSLWGLVLIYPTFTIPYATWMLISYFKSIPVEIEEAAFMDGCSRLRTMFNIVFPLSAPGIAATLIFTFTLSWSEYMYALIIISKSSIKPITLGLADMVVGDVFSWGPLMGGSIVASIPVIILYLFVSKYMVSGATMGGVK